MGYFNLKMNSVLLLIVMVGASLAYGSPRFQTAEVEVETAATSVPASATKVHTSHLVIKADSANAGVVYVGGADVSAANGYPLAQGQELRIGDFVRKDQNESFNLQNVHFDASQNGQKVRILYVQNRYKSSEPLDQ